MKSLTLVFVVLLAACAAVPTTTVRTLDEQNRITVLAEDLVGARIDLKGGASVLIAREDLDKFRFGVLGVKNSRREDLDSFTMQLEPGRHRVTVTLPDGSISERSIVVVAGQNAEIYVE
jgi:hypothetical protein